MHRQLADVASVLDASEVPELFVRSDPFPSAVTIGMDKPVIVVNSALVDLLDDDEMAFVLGHELGHALSGHAVYQTLLRRLLVLTGVLGSVPLGGLGLRLIIAALMEWSRKAELSADRAGLLATQDTRASLGTFMKMAGGGPGDDEANLDAFLEQASEYENTNSIADKVWQVVNTAFKTHPFGTVRAAELQRWIQSGAYDKILAGDYPRRGSEGERPYSDDFVDAAGYYGDQAKGAVETIGTVFNRAKDAFNSAFKGAGS
jgi:Zn-dependent protease with chaperone function